MRTTFVQVTLLGDVRAYFRTKSERSPVVGEMFQSGEFQLPDRLSAQTFPAAGHLQEGSGIGS